LRNDRRVFPEFVDKNAENLFYKEMTFWGVDKNVEYNPHKSARGTSFMMDYSKL
jgi:hypothetical protein